jgi:cytochrome P450
MTEMTATASGAELPVLEGFDPLDPEFLRDPYVMFERARREAPVFYYPGPPIAFWAVTKYDDVAWVHTDHKTFSSRVLSKSTPPPEFRRRISPDFVSQLMLALDPPDHTPVRRLQQKAFTRPRLEALEEFVRGIANELVDELLPRGRCDLLNDFARPMTMLTMLRYLGLPEDNRQRLDQYGEDLIRVLSDALNPMSEAERHERWERVVSTLEMFEDLVASRERLPTDEDPVAMLAHQAVAGECPVRSHEGLALDLTTFITAGTETTANLLCEIVKLLDESPEQREELRRDRSLLPNAVDEGLRRRASAIANFRIAKRDVEIGGYTVPEGAHIWACLASANHDEDRFPNPRTFDIHRQNAGEHLGFSKGTHYCLGAPLARLEARVGLETLLERMPNLRVPEQEIDYVPTLGLVVNMKTLRVEWA